MKAPSLKQVTEKLLEKVLAIEPNNFHANLDRIVVVCELGCDAEADRIRAYRLLALALEKLANKRRKKRLALK